MMIGFDMAARNEQVFTGYYKYDSNQRGEASFVTDVFEVKGHTSNVELTTSTDLNNRWIYLNYALINEDTGQAFDFGREVSYYHGYDSDGSWSEGSANDTVAVPKVPPGRYYLRVEPEGDPGIRGDLLHDHGQAGRAPVQLLWNCSRVLYCLPAILLTWRSLSFEHMRWAESDHPPIRVGRRRMIRTLYVIYGVAVLLGLASRNTRAGVWPVNEVKNVPRSVRDNPGSYRSVYSSYHHYTGGK